ncbi:hypothetical protein [Streptomyces scabiei]|uniref:hypothetical protein n=1 Tax=Streptomyces scabiei TaxID=1930 RepID=UPI0029A5C5E5|nr:hypothetical protein [Streptomyces scabiei]MDX3026756.1 hypothetical protein [Streptomyces scabiei]MDX3210034.1 hypothetical protein [Streptomyces scabiei]
MKFFVVVEEPVQVIAAELGTLAALTSHLRAGLAERLEQPADTIRLGDLRGFPLVADPQIPVGEVHLRPFPYPPQSDQEVPAP